METRDITKAQAANRNPSTYSSLSIISSIQKSWTKKQSNTGHIIERLGLERTLKIILHQTFCHGLAWLPPPRSSCLSNLALNASRDKAEMWDTCRGQSSPASVKACSTLAKQPNHWFRDTDLLLKKPCLATNL